MKNNLAKLAVVIVTGLFFAAATHGRSNNFIRNQTTLQSNANFNIDGVGKSRVFEAGEYFAINGFRMLRNGPAGHTTILVGFSAGDQNTGIFNTFVGSSSGYRNTTGTENAFFGSGSGRANNKGYGNSFFGHSAGQRNQDGFYNAFFGSNSGTSHEWGRDNAFFGERSGAFQKEGSYNTMIGGSTGFKSTTGEFISLFGWGANTGSAGLSYATAIGASAAVLTNNTVQLGRHTLDKVRIGTLVPEGELPICINGNNELAFCSSSKRYKTNISDFNSGIGIIEQLRPVSFRWKTSKSIDLGLVAEDVAVFAPELVSLNPSGEIEGVKYEKIGLILVNAVKEQQEQIRLQQKQNNLQGEKIENLEKKLSTLRSLICTNRDFAKSCG